MSKAARNPGEYWDAQLAKAPPVIEWQMTRGGIRVPVSVVDPHADGGHNGDKTSCNRGHKFTEQNTYWGRGFRECRTCKNELRKPLTPEQKRRAVALKRQRREERRALESMREEADEVAERFRKHRADNTPLMTAARTPL